MNLATFSLCGCGKRRSESVKYGLVLFFLGTFLVGNVSCKKVNATTIVPSPGFQKGSENVMNSFNSGASAHAKNDSVSDATNTNSFSAVGTGRQARDYSPGSGSGGSYSSSSSYGAPAGGGGGGYGSVAAGGGYGNPQYAIPPVILQSHGGGGGGGWGMTGGGWGGDDDDYGGEDLKGLLGLLGLGGLKGLKGLKALKGLGLLALAPLLLLALPLLLPLLLLPLLLLLFIPVPVISVPTTGRRKRDVNSGQVPTSKTLLQETIDDIMSQIPADFASLRWKDVDQCMDKFICDTGMMVSRVAPSMATPAAWLLAKLWPEPLQSKVETFRKVTEMMKNKKSYQDTQSRNSFYYSYNLHPAKHSNGVCAVNYKCRVKKLENLFHTLVVQQTDKLKEKLIERIPPGEMSAASIFRALLT